MGAFWRAFELSTLGIVAEKRLLLSLFRLGATSLVVTTSCNRITASTYKEVTPIFGAIPPLSLLLQCANHLKKNRPLPRICNKGMKERSWFRRI
jgi:hypothetical protein